MSGGLSSATNAGGAVAGGPRLNWALIARDPDNKPAAHRQASWLHRFDPRFWTVNFPRPMMAGVVTQGPAALRADAVFYDKGDLAGLIWESVDHWDHPLLAYETSRDYRRCQLRFRWRSGGIKPLDAVHGPTLTIEGRDAAGTPRAWYVRLWNYAVGTPEDAVVTLDFDALDGGFTLPTEAQRVYAGDIDRMFVSLVPPGFDGSAGALASAAEGWVELSEMRSTGSGSVLALGDATMPENGLAVATGYDDSYNLTPARIWRQIAALGYRGDIVHYVGMSHYFRLEREAGALMTSVVGGALNTPCARWHADYAAQAAALDMGIIWSLSYELFDAHCRAAWKQRAADGSPALTGWVPPSTLLSPANAEAMGYLQLVARAFVAIGKAAGLSPRFQVGEPWWWVQDGGKLCIYDAAAVAALGPLSVPMADVRGVLSAAQRAMLDAAGVLMAQSTAALVAAARDEAGPGGLTSYLLVFLPTVLDAAAPELRRANVPLSWARPAFDVLQLEDYDWVTRGRGAETGPATALMTARLAYPLSEQQYFAGFVLTAEQRGEWAMIADAAEAARGRGIDRPVIWALTQVARDGFVAGFAEQDEEAMTEFDDVDFPLSIGREASVLTEFSTQIIAAPSGHEQRSSEWREARMRYDAGPGVRSEQDLAILTAFFRARRGPARAFRFRDPFDASSALDGGAPGAADQMIGTGDGVRRDFALIKAYGGDDPQVRRITHPVPGSVVAAVNGAAVTSFAVEPGGILLFDAAPPAGAVVSAGFHFDVPVRFESDRLQISRATFAAGEAADVTLVEVRSA